MQEIKTKCKLKSLDGLKFIAVLAIFYWHFGECNFDFNIGARVCELLFVCSGFLVAYNSYKKYKEYNFKTQHTYVLKKFLQVWPLHIICLLLLMAYLFLNSNGYGKNDVFPLISNVFLLNAWNPTYAMSGNGVTWFLSCILFCYFMSPLFLYIIDRVSVNMSTVLFVLTFLIYFTLFLLYGKFNYKLFLFEGYTNPIIRCMEFALGIFIYPIFNLCLEKIGKCKKSKIIATIFSIVELTMIIGWILAGTYIKDRGGWLVIFSVPLVFIISLEKGVFSKFFGLKIFQSLSKIQSDFYISHVVVGNVVGSMVKLMFSSLISYDLIVLFIRLFAVLIFCYLYRKFVAKWTNKASLYFVNIVFEKLKINVRI